MTGTAMKIVKHRAGNLYDLIASSSEPLKRLGMEQG